MTVSAKQVYPVNGEKASSEIGVFIKSGGIILSASTNNLDKDLYNAKGQQQYFKFLHVGVGGNLVYLTPENEVDVFFDLPSGGFFPLHGYQVLSSASVNTYDEFGNIASNETVSTTCSNITWHGGE
ncbi:hypothetical protein UFOVP1361_67 [uncultured Caudovirales phage]|uniref:Uncharacterized protein n=1 Tax=uncultured Caudovirales phage TaxID=2100421 RepID=A0A6J5S4E8_9CAUD|nr:hypothetical protein UFOVP1361_67 [uncultured Caudovirales phage]